jgi:hypothetical protein
MGAAAARDGGAAAVVRQRGHSKGATGGATAMLVAGTTPAKRQFAPLETVSLSGLLQTVLLAYCKELLWPGVPLTQLTRCLGV